MSFLRRALARRCAVCTLAAGDPICAPCERDFFDPARHRCRRCALATGSHGGELCGRCLAEPPSFDQTLALADYRAPVDGMVAALKFSARLSLAVFFGRLLARRETALPDPERVVVPVPLAFERERERGFNQSHEIARVYARSAGLRLAPRMLVRIRHTAAQQTLALDERRHNVRGAFAMASALEGRHVIVVDDVMTSGSTLDEVARTLRAAGAESVVNRIVARTP